jgi:phosphoribosylamine---glycine ligase
VSNGNGNGNGHSEKNKYKFLFVSLGYAGDLAWQLKKEGHDVKYFLNPKYGDDLYDGFVEKVDSWKDHVEWADVIIFDDTGFGKIADELRASGKAVIGGTAYTDRLEEDREFGQSEMKRVGMLTLPHWDFEDYDSGLKFISENPGRYVFKPSGIVTSDVKDLLFLAREEDGRDLYEIINHNKALLQKNFKRFQLQKLASGIEIGASAFFNGVDFIYPITMGFEHKRLFPGELGPLTGEMGTSVFFCEPNYFFRVTLEKMKENLREAGYVGYIDINCIANGRGIYPLEFTCRFGYPFISIQLEGIVSPIGEFFHAIANKRPYDLKVKKGFQIGVVCATPPFPYYDKSKVGIYKDLSILFKKPNIDGVHLGDVKLVDGDWRLAGDEGYDLVVTGSGSTMEEARRQAYGRIDNIILQNMFYRTDIGASWSEDSDRLRTWGYLDQVPVIQDQPAEIKKPEAIQEPPTVVAVAVAKFK